MSKSPKQSPDRPHPRREPRIPLTLCLENLGRVFDRCADYQTRTVCLAGAGERTLTVCYIDGMDRTERLNDYVLRPLAQDERLARVPEGELLEHLRQGALYAQQVHRRTTLDQVAADLMGGCCALFLPGEGAALTVPVSTEEKRSVGEPENEPSLKGARDSFVESLRTNTSIVRRHLKAPELRIREQVVGRQSVTSVDILYIEGLTNPHLVEQVAAQLADIDIDAVLATGNIEEYIVPAARTAFPLVQYTERSDRFCAGLAEGRVGILIDGLPLGYLAPGVLGDFLQAPQDKSESWLLASALTLLRYLCMLGTLLLPALYVAMVTFHQEMIPTRLALSIIAAKQDVPFRSVFEVIVLLLAFEILQEAGLRLPQSIGQTVSIIGGLVVGSAAVEAKIISPAVLIVVAIAGIAGYTMPSQEVAGALRIWRFLLALLASAAGLFGVVAGLSALVIHLAGIESFGVSYLTPFASNAGEQVEGHAVFRQPLPQVKQRPAERDRIRFSFFMFGSSQSKIGAADGAGCKKTLLPHCWDKSVSTLLRYHPN